MTSGLVSSSTLPSSSIATAGLIELLRILVRRTREHVRRMTRGDRCNDFTHDLLPLSRLLAGPACVLAGSKARPTIWQGRTAAAYCIALSILSSSAIVGTTLAALDSGCRPSRIAPTNSTS